MYPQCEGFEVFRPVGKEICFDSLVSHGTSVLKDSKPVIRPSYGEGRFSSICDGTRGNLYDFNECMNVNAVQRLGSFLQGKCLRIFEQ